MTIPISQLETWSRPGADGVAQTTHRSIRRALEEAQQLSNKRYDPFLQGSYRNGTNVRADSDVDLVVRLVSIIDPIQAEERRIFLSDTDALSPEELRLYRMFHSQPSYGWDAFRTDVLGGLREYYGPNNIEEGKKAIKVKPAPGRLRADVVVTLEYRRYTAYRGPESEDRDCVRGIAFFDTQSRREIVNYPTQHYDNGVAKNADSRTGGQFKPVVRMFKNARGCLVEDGRIAPETAASYFIQCMLYNVPDSLFLGTLQDAYTNVVNYLVKARLAGFTCQNGITPLFGDTPEQWNTADAAKLFSALIQLWNGW